MKAKALKDLLKDVRDEVEIMVASDSGGTGFNHLEGVSLGIHKNAIVLYPDASYLHIEDFDRPKE
jgi:hypothetical protein